MLKKNNNEANPRHLGYSISSSNMTNLLHKIVVRQPSDQKEIIGDPTQRTIRTEEVEYL